MHLDRLHNLLLLLMMIKLLFGRAGLVELDGRALGEDALVVYVGVLTTWSRVIFCWITTRSVLGLRVNKTASSLVHVLR